MSEPGLGGCMEARQAYDAVSAIVDPVYMVGGSVRDALMCRECHDFDFATPLDPDKIEELVRAHGRHPYLVGKRFGTVGFRVDGETVEVTTFRTEIYSEGSRKPAVEFLGDLEDDLARRDFTINAMAIHADEIVDPFGGRDDIARRVVRAVGDARERLSEDPLRMLRAARFSAELDFAVAPETVSAIAEMPERILSVARERWMLELDRLLVGPAAASGMRLLAETNLLAYLLPELSAQIGIADTSQHGGTLFDATLGRLAAAPADATLRWSALLADVGKPFAALGASDGAAPLRHELIGAQIVERAALYLKWSNRRREDVKRLVVEQAQSSGGA